MALSRSGASETSHTGFTDPSSSSTTHKKDDVMRSKGMEFAKANVEKQFAGSAMPDNTKDFPRFTLGEVKLGKVLGKGGFGTVSEVRAFDCSQDSTKMLQVKGGKQDTPSKEFSSSFMKHAGTVRNMFAKAVLAEEDEDSAEAMESRKFISDHCIRNGGDARYALKILSPEVIANTGQFIQGVIDMAVETRFLSGMEHPHIIKMRAIAQCEPYNERYFIVMDRLYDTLEKRIKTWELRSKRHGGIGRLAGGKKKAAAMWEERIVAAFDLASAVQYMHSRSLIYRDLKPENVGFDIRGDIKIFDFGLAKELSAMTADDHGLYKLTGMTGSPRYMAPEVGLEKPYNATCDSYSFAILLWEMLSLFTPFELYTAKTLKAKVWQGGKRPGLKEEWPVSIKLLLKRSWDEDVSQRNSMEQVEEILRKEAARCRGGDETGLEHHRRRSTFVFRPSPEAQQKRAALLNRMSAQY